MKSRLVKAAAACAAAVFFLAAAISLKTDIEEKMGVVHFPEEYPEAELYGISDAEIKEKVDALLKTMTEDELYSMLGGSTSAASMRGYGTGYIGGVPRLGVPVLRMWDGPKGVIGDGNLETTSPASQLALAASFDEDLAFRYGAMTGKENRATAGNVQLGVQVDNARMPFFMRSRDSLGEDPYLTSRMGNKISEGVQSEHVISMLKHFAGYSSHFERSDPVQIDEQTLEEVYFAPFEYIIRQKNALGLMAAWNQLNGKPFYKNPELMKDVLRDRWGFEGFTTVDWRGNEAFSIPYGIDAEMPILTENSRENIEKAIAEGSMTMDDAKEAVRHILTAMGKAGYLNLVKVKKDGTAAADEAPPFAIELPKWTGESRANMLEQDDALALESATKGAVLLKNQDEVLPLQKDDDVLLVGTLAKHTMNYYYECSYGWYAKMTGTYDDLKEIMGTDADVTVSEGLDTEGVPIPEEYLYTSKDCIEHGVNVTIDGVTSEKAQPILTTGTIDGKENRTWKNAKNGDALEYGSQVSMTTYLKAPETGIYEMQLLKIGGTVGAAIKTDVEVSISGSGTNTKWPFTGVVPAQNGMDIPKDTTKVVLLKGKVYKITIEGTAESEDKDLQLSLNWYQPGQREKTYDEAVKAAAEHKKIVFFAYDVGGGDSNSIEKAARRNRSSLELSQKQKRLLKDITDVAKENGGKVIVVLNTALPVTMDWLPDVDAVLEMWLSGQSGGKAAAQLLTGEKNPSGKLPITFPNDINDTQLGNYKENYNRERVSNIDHNNGGEGIFYGYRWYDHANITPLFPFGFGLSYTTFAYSDLKISQSGDGYDVTFTVKNTGDVAGTEIAQVYLGAADVPDNIQMADYALAGFARLEGLKPQEAREVTVKVEKRQLSYWDINKTTEDKWTVAQGDRMFYVGASSDDLRLKQQVNVSNLEKIAQ